MRTIKFYLIGLNIFIVILTISQQTPAQYADQFGRQWTTNMGGVFNNPMSAMASTMIWNKINEQVMVNAVKKKNGFSSNSSTSNSASNSANPVQTPKFTAQQIKQAVQFKPTGNRLMLQTIVDKLGGTDEQKVQTSKLLSAILDGYDREAAKNGYPNDLALAIASFIAFNSAVYQEKTIVPDEKILQVRNLIAELIAQNGFFNSVSDLQKQQTYEVLIMLGGLAYISYEDAKKRNSTEEMKIFRQLAAANIKLVLGMEPDTLDFTAESVSLTNTQNSNTNTSASSNPVEIRQLALDFKENELRANQLYKGKRIIVFGIVGSIEKYGGVTVLVFERGLLNPETICYFTDKNQLAQLRRLQTVTVEATVRGFENYENINVILDNCVLR